MLGWLFKKKKVEYIPKELAKHYKLKTKSIDEIIKHYHRMGMYNPFFTPQSHYDELKSTVVVVEDVKDGWVKFKKNIVKANEETRSSKLYYVYTVENFLKDHEFFGELLHSLQSSHIGDCTTFPYSTTNRGYGIYNFNDYNGESCSIQKSSIVTNDAIWLGIDDAKPIVMHVHAKRLGIETDQTSGWVPYPVPEEVLMTTRMHLTREQVREMLPILENFVNTGEIYKPNIEEILKSPELARKFLQDAGIINEDGTLTENYR